MTPPPDKGVALDFVHVYQPAAREGAPTLLLLHGTGGDERDLLPLGPALAPGAGVLSPRGQVLERGMPRFFRRLAEGVFDINTVIAGILVLTIFALLLDYAVTRIEARLLVWRPTTAETERL